MGQQTVEFQAINYYWTLGNLNRDLDFNVRSMSIDLFGLFDILLQKIRYQCFDDVFFIVIIWYTLNFLKQNGILVFLYGVYTALTDTLCD